MKIRNGFVSNSSSSSFIVAFPKKPTSVEEVKEMLFKNKETHLYWEDNISTQKISQTVFNDLQGQLKLSVTDVAEEIENSWWYHYWDGGITELTDKGLIQKKFSGNGHKYFGTNPSVLVDIETKVKKAKKAINVIDEKLDELLVENKIIHPKGKFDSPEVKEYYKQCDKFKQNSVEYKKLKEQQIQLSRQEWEDHTLESKGALSDANEFLKQNKGKYIARFSYADDDGAFFAAMEHSGIFDKLEHMTFSHH